MGLHQWVQSRIWVSPKKRECLKAGRARDVRCEHTRKNILDACFGKMFIGTGQILLVSHDVPANISQKCPISCSFSVGVPLLLCSSLEVFTDSWEWTGSFCVVDSSLRLYGQIIELHHQTPDLSSSSLIWLDYGWCLFENHKWKMKIKKTKGGRK